MAQSTASISRSRNATQHSCALRLIGCIAVLLLLAMPANLSAQAVEWIKQFYADTEDFQPRVSANSAGIYVGSTERASESVDGFLRKFDLGGNLLWAQQIGTNAEDVIGGVVARGTEIYVVGHTFGTFPGERSSGNGDGFIRQYDRNGFLHWTHQFGSADFEEVISVAADNTDVYVAGIGNLPDSDPGASGDIFVRKYNTFGRLLWSRQIDFGRANMSIAAANPGFYLAGSIQAGSIDGLLQKNDPSGNLVWSRQFGTPAGENPFGVAANADSVYVVGITVIEGLADAFVRQYDSDGNEGWTRQFGTPKSDEAIAVSVDKTGVYVAGNWSYPIPGENNPNGGDAFVRKYDLDGNIVWDFPFGSPARDFAESIAAVNGKVYVAGTTSGNLVGELENQTSDVFLADFCRNSTAISPIAASLPRSSGSVSIYVTAGAECSWITQTTAPWITLSASSNGTGNSTASFSVQSNDLPPPRSTNVVIAGQPFAVTQEGTGCTYTLDRTSESLPTSGGFRILHVHTTPGCPWIATTAAEWISLNPVSGAGNGDVRVSASYNPNGTPRIATIDIARVTLTLTQTGIGCTYSAGPQTQSLNADAQTGTVGVFTNLGCPWFATSNAEWISITSGANGAGSATVRYAAAANPALTQRTGTITVASQTVTVTQSRVAPVINTGGVVNNASYAPSPAPVAPGSIVAIFGTNLNDGSTVTSSGLSSNGRLATTLGGASVRIGNTLAPIFYSTPGQLGIQIPFEVSASSATVTVITGNVFSESGASVALSPVAPGIFTTNQAGIGPAAVLHQDGSTPVTAENPAHPDEVVSFYATGMGVVTPPLATGAPASSNATVLVPTATVDGTTAEVPFSGAAPGFVGLNQVNVRIPDNARIASDVAVQLTVNGRQSNTVTIPVGP